VSDASPTFDWGRRTYVMGILNLTPDSFSGDGLVSRPEDAVRRVQDMVGDGADLIDVGGMSSRPGHNEISADEELGRVMAVLPRVVAEAGVLVSIDTYRSEVAQAAVEAGAGMINDIWGLKREPWLAELAARHKTWLVLMHNQEGTDYEDLVPEVLESLHDSVAVAEAAGVPRSRIIVDPGVGFGKTAEQNLVILNRLAEFRALELPILIGTSRKSTIGKVLDLPVDERVEGTAATVALGIGAGADMVRVHDVRAMVRVARMADAVVRQPG
jgi:dihydropteroate synthase